jgi:hypothetical protein
MMLTDLRRQLQELQRNRGTYIPQQQGLKLSNERKLPSTSPSGQPDLEHKRLSVFHGSINS